MNEQTQKAIIRTTHSLTCGNAYLMIELCDDKVCIVMKQLDMNPVTVELSRDDYSDFISELFKSS